MLTTTLYWKFILITFALALTSCASDPLRKEWITTTKSGDKIRNIEEYTLTNNAVGIVGKHYAGGWSPRSIASGKSHVLRLYRSSFLIGSFDGSSHSEILIQLPSDLIIKQRYKLIAASADRATKTDKYDNITGDLKNGEIVAYQFGNPSSGDLKKVDIAWVEVISIGAKTAEIHLRLKAKLDPQFDFDINKKYTVKIAPKQVR